MGRTRITQTIKPKRGETMNEEKNQISQQNFPIEPLKQTVTPKLPESQQTIKETMNNKVAKTGRNTPTHLH